MIAHVELYGALTNDTLTEWGGGVAFWDTLVEVGHPA